MGKKAFLSRRSGKSSVGSIFKYFSELLGSKICSFQFRAKLSRTVIVVISSSWSFGVKAGGGCLKYKELSLYNVLTLSFTKAYIYFVT